MVDGEEEQADESEPDDSEERPEIEGDERADVDLEDLELDTEAIEEEAGAGSEQDDAGDEGDDTAQDPDDDGTDESDTQPTLPEGDSWGDQYVDMLALLLGEIAEASDGETGKDAEAIESLARQPPVELDQAVDRWLAESGMSTDLPPGKQVMFGTAGLALVVLLTETDVAQDAISDIADDMEFGL